MKRNPEPPKTTHTTPTRWLLAGAAGLILLCAGSFYAWRGAGRTHTWQGIRQTHAAVEASAGYADPASCAECHEDVAATYRQTGMGRSFHRMTDAKPVEDFTKHNTLYHKDSDRYYSMLERDGKFYESRHQIGFGGRETNQEEKQIDFVIGSGN